MMGILIFAGPAVCDEIAWEILLASKNYSFSINCVWGQEVHYHFESFKNISIKIYCPEQNNSNN